MQRVERARKLLDKIAQVTGLTADGKDWLIAVTDPMHDEKLHVSGYPDREFGASVVQVVKQSLTVQKPAGVAAPWQFSVIMDDDMRPSAKYLGTVNGDHISQDLTLVFPILQSGGLTVVASSAASAVGMPFTQIGSTNALVGQLSVAADSVSKFRVISQGFEVVNTTAELYKSGSVVVWEQPTSVEQGFTAHNVVLNPGGGDPLPIGVASPNLIWDAAPPSNVSTALLLEGSQQWEAKDGAYCVASMNTLDNVPQFATPVSKLHTETELLGPDLTGQQPRAWLDPGIYSAPLGRNIVPNHFVTPYNRKGCYVLGLTEQSTFVINYNVILETFPTQTNRQLIVLATPSACEDPVATHLYSQILCKMPVGVHFSENGMGDWFLGIVDAVANNISQVGKPLMGALQGYLDIRSQQVNDRTKAEASGRQIAPNTWLQTSDIANATQRMKLLDRKVSPETVKLASVLQQRKKPRPKNLAALARKR